MEPWTVHLEEVRQPPEPQLQQRGIQTEPLCFERTLSHLRWSILTIDRDLDKYNSVFGKAEFNMLINS